MDKEEKQFLQIIDELSNFDSNIKPGKMMSAPGIKYKSKVFAFYYNQEMVFRLGKDFDPESEGISEFSYLNPFKNKPPMKGWLQIGFQYENKWLPLANKAYQLMKRKLDKSPPNMESRK